MAFEVFMIVVFWVLVFLSVACGFGPLFWMIQNGALFYMWVFYHVQAKGKDLCTYHCHTHLTLKRKCTMQEHPIPKLVWGTCLEMRTVYLTFSQPMFNLNLLLLRNRIGPLILLVLEDVPCFGLYFPLTFFLHLYVISTHIPWFLLKWKSHSLLVFNFFSPFPCFIGRSWLPSQLGLLFSWCTWPPSPSLELVSTQPGALELPSSTTGTMHGMTM